MRVETLPKSTSGNLTRKDFWQSAIDLVLSDLPEFLAMTDHKPERVAASVGVA